MLFLSGCVKETPSDSYCDIAELIPHTNAELKRWTIKHYRAVDNHNERYIDLCQQ